MLLLKLNDQRAIISQAFWGLWLFPLGLLVIRSRFLFSVVGGWPVVNGVAYLANCFTALLLSQHAALVSKITFPFLFGEVAFTLWLLVVGARSPRGADPAVSSAVG
jgi:hypothetical protein